MSKNEFIKPTTAKERSIAKARFYKKKVNHKKWKKELELEKKLQDEYIEGLR